MTNIVPFRRVSRVDGFVNRITGYGTTRDHGQQYNWEMNGRRYGKQQLDNMRAYNELLWKITDLLPLNALRRPLLFNKHDEKDQKKIRKALRDSGFMAALRKGLPLDRLHGGVAVFIPANDGGTDEDEVNFDTLVSIDKVMVVELDYLTPENMTRSMRHTHYVITKDDGSQQRIHKSRLIFAPSVGASDDFLMENNGRPPSIALRCLDALLDYGVAHGLITNVLKDLIRDVIKLQGLNELSLNDCAEDQQAFNDRLDAMFLAQSLLNKLVLDIQDEYQRQVTPMGGVPETVGLTWHRLTAASGMPHTILFGEAPGGSLGEGGKSQKDDWNESTEAYQMDQIDPMLDEFMPFLEKLTGIEEIQYSHSPLIVLSKEQLAVIFEKMANALAKLVEAGIISPAEAATAFNGNEVEPNIVLDLATRAALDKEAEEQLKELFEPTPEPQPMAPGQMNGAPNGTQNPSQDPEA